MRHDEILGLLHALLARGQDATILWAGRWELAFWLLVLLLTALLALRRPRWMPRAEDAFRRLSRHRRACVWAIGGAAIAIRALLLPLVPVPVPVILDEYSYLLGSDTFAAGRLTNPPHPMWIHFESFNINMQPTYQSMYPPSQALVLGLAQRLAGQPWIGVLLSVAAMCAAFTWALQGWMPPPWALLGGLYAVFRYAIFSYWIDSYWGGAMAALGGALLLGALPRLRRELTWRHSAIFAIGLVILANSRPFEGLLFALPMLLTLAWLAMRSPMPRRRRVSQIVLSCVLLVGVAAAGMLYYNWRSTGNALLMPYTLNQNTYHVSRPFLFQKPYPIPNYRNPQMRTFYMFHEYPDLLNSRSAWGLQHLMEQKFFCYYVFFAWPTLLLFIPGLIFAAADKELRIVWVSLMLVLAGLTVQLWPAHGHYAAPAAVAVLLIQLNALRRLRNAGGPHPPAVGECGEQRGSEGGPHLRPLQMWGESAAVASSSISLWFSRAVVLGLALIMLLPIADRLWNPYMLDDFGIAINKQIDRERILAQLQRTPGEHLVLVHYQQRDVPSVEWVYNRADIDHAKVVWARDMGPAANRELLRYFRNRQIWYVDRNAGARLEPYTYSTKDPFCDVVSMAHCRVPAVSCHPANGLPPACEVVAALGLPQPALP